MQRTRKGRARTTIQDSGTFRCPQEGVERGYDLVVMKKPSTVLSLAGVGKGDLGSYVECQSCGATYRPEVLSRPDSEQEMDTFTGALRQLAVEAIVADGFVKLDETDAVVTILEQHFGVEYPADELAHDIESRNGEDIDLADTLRQCGSFLNLEGRQALLKCAVLLAAVDGEVTREERALIRSAGKALGMTKAQIRELTALTVSRGDLTG